MAPRTGIDQVELKARIDGILNRHPAVGLAVGVVRNGSLEFFHGHGLADVASNLPITEDTVFRIGSITKTFTLIAMMQLWEQGLVDLDAPANDYLRAYKLVPAKPGFRPATVRHLLTHTAGIPEVVYVADLLHPGWGPFEGRPVVRSVRVGEPLPSLAEYYRGGLRLVAEPGSAFAFRRCADRFTLVFYDHRCNGRSLGRPCDRWTPCSQLPADGRHRDDPAQRLAVSLATAAARSEASFTDQWPAGLGTLDPCPGRPSR